MLGWILLGAAAAAVALTYWDKIKIWLNTIVADTIEKIFGYGARERVHHAVSITDRVASGVRERIFVFVGKATGKGYNKYEEKRTRIISDVEEDVVKEITENGPLIREFSYTEME